MTWIEDIGTYLQTNHIGTLATDIFYQGFDDSVPNCITLFNQGGPGALTTASGDYTIKYPELGLRVRNADDATAYNKAKSILDLLIDVSNTVIRSSKIISIEAINSDPLFVEQDENNRYVYSVNFSITIEGT
jgi:hypothetical protein